MTTALYLCQINQKKDKALCSFAEAITIADGKSAAKGRAWANVFLLGSDAKGIVDMHQKCKAEGQ